MIYVDIKNRWSGEVQTTAKIDCCGSESYSVKLGLAAQWAAKNGGDLYGANLRHASLRNADMRDADLRHADLRNAILSGADLSGANLSGAELPAGKVAFVHAGEF